VKRLHPAVSMRPPDRTSRARRSIRSGFTLIEVVIVLLIVGTMAAIAMPRFARSLDRYRADASARRIVADFDQARSAARATSASVTVVFDVAAERYSIPELADLNGSSGGYVVELHGGSYRCRIVSAAFDTGFESNDPTVIFDGYGRPDSGGAVVIRVGEFVRMIAIDRDSAQATIQ